MPAKKNDESTTEPATPSAPEPEPEAPKPDVDTAKLASLIARESGVRGVEVLDHRVLADGSVSVVTTAGQKAVVDGKNVVITVGPGRNDDSEVVTDVLPSATRDAIDAAVAKALAAAR